MSYQPFIRLRLRLVTSKLRTEVVKTRHTGIVGKTERIRIKSFISIIALDDYVLKESGK